MIDYETYENSMLEEGTGYRIFMDVVPRFTPVEVADLCPGNVIALFDGKSTFGPEDYETEPEYVLNSLQAYLVKEEGTTVSLIRVHIPGSPYKPSILDAEVCMDTDLRIRESRNREIAFLGGVRVLQDAIREHPQYEAYAAARAKRLAYEAEQAARHRRSWRP